MTARQVDLGCQRCWIDGAPRRTEHGREGRRTTLMLGLRMKGRRRELNPLWQLRRQLREPCRPGATDEQQ